MLKLASAYEYLSTVLKLPISVAGLEAVIKMIGLMDSAVKASSLDVDVNQLKRFGELTDPLTSASEAMRKFAAAYPGIAESLALPIKTAGLMTVINLIDLLDATIKRSSLDADIDKLKRFGELTDPMNTSSDAMLKLASAYEYLSTVLKLPISVAGLEAVIGLIDLLDRAILGSSLDYDIDELKRFGELTDPLTTSAVAMQRFADAYAYGIEQINKSILSDDTINTLEVIRQIFSPGGAMVLMSDWVLASDPVVERLDHFGELSEPLTLASVAILQFGESYAKAVGLINDSIFGTNALFTMDMFDYILREGAFMLLGDWLLTSDGIISRLASIEDATGNIPVVADRLYYFADAYSYLVDAFSDSISTDSLSNLYNLADLINRQATLAIPNVISSTFGAGPGPELSSGGPTATVPTAGAGTNRSAHHSPEQRHKEMMEALNKLNNNIESLLLVEDRQVRVMSDGFSKVAAVVY
jgi:hypothetical protein